MTTKTSIGRVVVIAVVASYTVIGNSRVRTIQHIKVIVNIESRWHPVRCGGVAACTIRRQIQGYVIRVYTLRIIRRVAPGAGIGRVVVIAVMTDDTIIRNGRMRTSQRIVHTMIKSTGYPGCF